MYNKNHTHIDAVMGFPLAYQKTPRAIPDDAKKRFSDAEMEKLSEYIKAYFVSKNVDKAKADKAIEVMPMIQERPSDSKGIVVFINAKEIGKKGKEAILRLGKLLNASRNVGDDVIAESTKDVSENAWLVLKSKQPAQIIEKLDALIFKGNSLQKNTQHSL